MNITKAQLKEMVRKAVKIKLQENLVKPEDIPDDWAKYMEEVEKLFAETIEKFSELEAKGEELKAEEREKGQGPSVPDRANNAAIYGYLDERKQALKKFRASMAQKLEIWRTRY